MAFLAVLFPQTLYSQAGQKWSTRGNNASAGDFIGTTNNVPLELRSGNIPALTLLPDGNDKITIQEMLDHFDNADTHRTIDDNIVSSTSLWSSDKISTELANVQFGDTIRTKVIIGRQQTCLRQKMHNLLSIPIRQVNQFSLPILAGQLITRQPFIIH